MNPVNTTSTASTSTTLTTSTSITSTTNTYTTTTTSNTYLESQISENIACFDLDTFKKYLEIIANNTNMVKDQNAKEKISDRITLIRVALKAHSDDSKVVEEKIKDLIKLNTSILDFLNPSPAQEWLGKTLDAIDIAEKNQSFEAVANLLDEGNQRNFLNEEIRSFKGSGTLLHVLANRRARLYMLRLLLKYDINPLPQDPFPFGNTALHYAIANANDEAAMELIDLAKKHDFLNIQCNCGNSALHIAVAKGYKNISMHNEELKHSYLDIINKLISHSCNVNLQNYERMGKNSPLHLACLRREPEMIEVLLKAGADLSLKNAKGKTAKELLDFDYESAAAIIKTTVIIYLLDKKEHKNNLNKCHDLFN
jgi:ankyrin repeat protein